MEALIEWLMSLSVEYAGQVSPPVLFAAWKLRTPEARQNLRTEIATRLKALWADTRANFLRWEILPFALSLTPAIFLEDTRFAVASQAVFAAVLLAYGGVAVWYISGKFR